MSTSTAFAESVPVRVLIIEDSEEDAELIELELRRGGFSPLCCRVDTPNAMKQALQEKPWDIVLSDYCMPAFSIEDALGMLREADGEVPFLIVSATIGEEAAVEAMRAGAQDYVLKHRLDRLVPAVRRELHESFIRRQRKKLEEQLRHAQKLESIGLLAGGVAHDFNNLLTGILGNAALVLDILEPPEPARGMLQEIVTTAERASELTRQLLAYAGKGTFVIESIHVSELIDSMADLIRTSTDRSIDLHVDLAPDVPLIEADQGQIRQIIMNMVVNAAEAIGRRAGTLTIETFAREIGSGETLPSCCPAAPVPGLYAAIRVTDTGCGMSPDITAQIFDPFFTTKFTGRGLGLAAVLGIVRKHNGVIQVCSTHGEGSSFLVLLPARPPVMLPKGQPAHRSSAACDLTSSGVILVVDDEAVVRHAARAALEHYGYIVYEAADGQEGVDLFRRLQEVSAVLLDLTMPTMNGQQAYEEIRQIRPNVKVLVSSGFDEFETRRRFGNAPGLSVLQKPYTAAELGGRVKALLSE